MGTQLLHMRHAIRSRLGVSVLNLEEKSQHAQGLSWAKNAGGVTQARLGPIPMFIINISVRETMYREDMGRPIRGTALRKSMWRNGILEIAKQQSALRIKFISAS